MKLCIQEEHLHGEEQEIESSKLTTSGNYYFHILAVDNSGNSKEYISEAVTIKSGYAISTPQDFQNMGSNLSASYYIVNDIDMNGFEFKCIQGKFNGKLDGQGHTISNLTITDGGIFRFLLNSTFENILFKNVNLSGGGGVLAKEQYLSATSIIRKVGITGSVDSSDTNTSMHTGSFIGDCNGKTVNLTFENCYAKVDVAKTRNGCYDKGGFIGDEALGANVIVTNSYWYGSTGGTHRTGAFRGGIGIENNGNQSTESITVTNSFYNKTLFTLSVPEESSGKGLTTAEFADSSNFTGWDFENTWYMSDEGYPELKFD